MLIEKAIIYCSNLHIHFQVLCNQDLRLLLPAHCPKTEDTRSIAKCSSTNNSKVFNRNTNIYEYKQMQRKLEARIVSPNCRGCHHKYVVDEPVIKINLIRLHATQKHFF